VSNCKYGNMHVPLWRGQWSSFLQSEFKFFESNMCYIVVPLRQPSALSAIRLESYNDGISCFDCVPTSKNIRNIRCFCRLFVSCLSIQLIHNLLICQSLRYAPKFRLSSYTVCQNCLISWYKCRWHTRTMSPIDRYIG
jgi:hypothetical protein